MVKNVPPHLAAKARRCIFCGRPGLTKTHVWPDWLRRSLPQRTHRFVETSVSLPKAPEARFVERKALQGALFTIKPLLACGSCNAGWMKSIEDDVLKFAREAIVKGAPVRLRRKQVKSLAAWIGLICVLAEHLAPNTRRGVIGDKTRRHFMNKLEPPPHGWTIFVCSQNGATCDQFYRFRFFEARHVLIAERRHEGAGRPSEVFTKTQISSFGTGKLYFQVLISNSSNMISDYQILARSTGFIQIWPLPQPLMPLPAALQGSIVQLPTKLVLDDDGANELAETFYNLIREVGVANQRRVSQ